MHNMMNKRQFIEMTVKEQRSVVFKVNKQDEFFRGISTELNEDYLFVETEEGINLKFLIDDITEIYAVNSSSPMHSAIQSHSLLKGSKDDLENLVLQFESLNDDVKKQITSSLSKVLGKQVIISKMDITSYNLSEIEMIANTINGYILTIKTLDIRSEFFESYNNMDLPEKTCFGKVLD
ncbi:hypothetical protein J45TS6_32240 [Paenibacillus sp. J45TS6]|uniref:hypothetical protein n=1 Tax=Paenibacillus sp. J45TS6 TaxID=2807196 RepID=UPI001B0D18D6|nr:hypothetical protein [Paenibacillus sp. J45TS6]GIP44765.1 hypothetical protein J45TS6_32240 [Paenibacillus sp. J45TS6]